MENFKIIIPHEGVNEIPKGYKAFMADDGRLIAIVPENASADDFMWLQTEEIESPINWEQRRFEVAKALISGMLANRTFPSEKVIADDCETAIKYANEMINQ